MLKIISYLLLFHCANTLACNYSQAIITVAELQKIKFVSTTPTSIAENIVSKLGNVDDHECSDVLSLVKEVFVTLIEQGEAVIGRDNDLNPSTKATFGVVIIELNNFATLAIFEKGNTRESIESGIKLIIPPGFIEFNILDKSDVEVCTYKLNIVSGSTKKLTCTKYKT